MKDAEQIRTITYMKTKPAELLKEAENNDVIITQNGEAKAVLQDLNSYQQQKQALLLLKLLALGEQDVKAERLTDQDKVFSNLLKGH